MWPVTYFAFSISIPIDHFKFNTVPIPIPNSKKGRAYTFIMYIIYIIADFTSDSSISRTGISDHKLTDISRFQIRRFSNYTRI